MYRNIRHNPKQQGLELWHEPVRIVDDQQVPEQLRPPVGMRCAAVGDELLQDVGSEQSVAERDDSGQRAPRVGLQAHALPQLVDSRLADNYQGEGKTCFPLPPANGCAARAA